MGTKLLKNIPVMGMRLSSRPLALSRLQRPNLAVPILVKLFLVTSFFFVSLLFTMRGISRKKLLTS